LENFWGNLSTWKKAVQQNDLYTNQLQEIGYRFDKGKESPVPFSVSIQWVLNKIDWLIKSKQLNKKDVILPGKAFLVDNSSQVMFVSMNQKIPKHAKELNLLPPNVFVKMLSSGYFPIGAPIREHTNQTLCEHDLAHCCAFIHCVEYMKEIKLGFQLIERKMQTNPKIATVLSQFDSLYSLRLYYMIEIFCIIPNAIKLEKILDLKIADFSLDSPEMIYPNVTKFLLKKSPSELSCYLYHVYEEFHNIVQPLGAESLDIVNRTRKFSKSNQSGSFYARMSNLDSKYNGSSLYSMLLNAKASLEYKRSNHFDYMDSIREIHAPVIAALLGTAQLTIKDWIHEAIKEIPDPNSKICRYICKTGLWNKSHVLYWCYSDPDYSKILTFKDFK
jgi:hypothetical protein